MEVNKYKRVGAPLLAGPTTHGLVCSVCECEYEVDADGSNDGMCPDCAEAYRIWHEATDWMH